MLAFGADGGYSDIDYDLVAGHAGVEGRGGGGAVQQACGVVSESDGPRSEGEGSFVGRPVGGGGMQGGGQIRADIEIGSTPGPPQSHLTRAP